jgi:hypothetical protein
MRTTKQINKCAERLPDPAPKHIRRAPSVRYPDETERLRLLGALRPAELEAWQATRAAMLLDYLMRSSTTSFGVEVAA